MVSHRVRRPDERLGGFEGGLELWAIGRSLPLNTLTGADHMNSRSDRRRLVSRRACPRWLRRHWIRERSSTRFPLDPALIVSTCMQPLCKLRLTRGSLLRFFLRVGGGI